MGAATNKEWFYISLGHRRGPVSHDEICRMLEKQELYAESTKVWKEGMKEWVDVIDAKPFASLIKKLRAQAAKEDVRVRVGGASGSSVDVDLVCRGATRGLFNMFFYLLWVLPLAIGVVIFTELQVYHLVSQDLLAKYSWLTFTPLIFCGLVLLRLGMTRMNHAGYTRRYGWWLLVPVVNIWALLICLCAPRNYRRTKEWGAPAAAFLALFLLASSAGVVSLMGYVPAIDPDHLSPRLLSDKMTTFYKEKAHFQRRISQDAQKQADAESKRRQKKMKEKLAEEQKAMQKKRGL